MNSQLRVLVACDIPTENGEFLDDGRLYEMVVLEMQPHDSKIGIAAWGDSRESTDCTIAEHLFHCEGRPPGVGLWVWEGVPEFLQSDLAEETGWIFRKGSWRRPTRLDAWSQLDLD